MGFKIIAQFTLIVAALIIIFAYIQPSLAEMRAKQDNLDQYNEAISKAAEFNARLRELISIRDSFSPSDLESLEKFLPAKIDELKIMSEITGIFSNSSIPITEMTSDDVVSPVEDVALESGIEAEAGSIPNLSYQDFEVTFNGTYEELRWVLMNTEASDSLLEVIELSLATPENDEIDEDGNVIEQLPNGDHAFKIIFRTYGLPVTGQ